MHELLCIAMVVLIGLFLNSASKSNIILLLNLELLRKRCNKLPIQRNIPSRLTLVWLGTRKALTVLWCNFSQIERTDKASNDILYLYVVFLVDP
jgi:hypothetical protein